MFRKSTSRRYHKTSDVQLRIYVSSLDSNPFSMSHYTHLSNVTIGCVWQLRHLTTKIIFNCFLFFITIKLMPLTAGVSFSVYFIQVIGIGSTLPLILDIEYNRHHDINLFSSLSPITFQLFLETEKNNFIF